MAICLLGGCAGAQGDLAYRTDLQICRNALSVSSGRPEWESRLAFQPSVREAQSRGLKIEDCVTLVAEGKEGARPRRHEMAVVLQWEGVAPLATGWMRTDALTDRGDITLSFGDPKVDCMGRWIWKRGKYNTLNPPEGTWSVGCSNGLSASGGYKSHRPSSGEGSGTDQQGRRITFSFSGDAS